MLLVVGLAMSGLLLLSAVPWSRLTGNIIKDFNLFGQLFPEDSSDERPASDVRTEIDPELADFLAETAVAESVDTAASVAETAVAEADSAAVAVPHTEAPVVNGVVAIENYLPGGSGSFPRLKAALGGAANRTVRIDRKSTRLNSSHWS